MRGTLAASAAMRLEVKDAAYTDRLATFLRSVGQTVTEVGPSELDVEVGSDPEAGQELELYLRVWRVLYPEAEVVVKA